VTLPVRSRRPSAGPHHPISQASTEIARFRRSRLPPSPKVPISRPTTTIHRAEFPGRPSGARDATTLFSSRTKRGERKLLRTHTSPVQIRTMEKRSRRPHRYSGQDLRQDSTPPTRRCSISRGPGDRQDGHVANMKWVLEEFCKAFFEVPSVKMRFRPSFFPFTSQPRRSTSVRPLAAGEVRFGEGSDWMEISAWAWCIPTCCAPAGSIPTSTRACLGHGHRPHRHAEIRHAGPARLLRRRRALLSPLRFSGHSTCRRCSEGLSA